MDGKQVNGNTVLSAHAQEIVTPLPNSTRVIAVQVTNMFEMAGFKAVSSDGRIVSNGSWKCTSVFSSGWLEANFNDSSWPPPAVTTNEDICKGFPSSALWLWTERTYSSLNTMYCRKTLQKI